MHEVSQSVSQEEEEEEEEVCSNVMITKGLSVTSSANVTKYLDNDERAAIFVEG